MSTLQRIAAADLLSFASAVLHQAGLATDRASVVADVLLEGDLLGHSTHGLQLLVPYVQALEQGQMQHSGEPAVVADRPAAFTWDGGFLPGPWLVRRALQEAIERTASEPVVTAVIRRSHHIACLAAYLRQATDRGLVVLLNCSDPSVASVAPFGSVQALYTPNPMAAGFPTSGQPVLMDISASTTTNGMVARLNRLGGGQRLPGPWLVDAQGQPSDDPAVMAATPPGAILPLGGADQGYKGFALGLLVEAMTSALGGHGRADGEDGWGASVFLQLINPAAFAGLDAFTRQTGWLADACRSAAVPPGRPPVRLPGERAQALREQQLREGVELHPEIVPALAALAMRFGLTMPGPVAAAPPAPPAPSTRGSGAAAA